MTMKTSHCFSFIPVCPDSSAIIIEGGIVMEDVRDLPLAVCFLFGLSYAHLLYYPLCNFTQQVMLELGSNSLKPKLQIQNMSKQEFFLFYLLNRFSCLFSINICLLDLFKFYLSFINNFHCLTYVKGS